MFYSKTNFTMKKLFTLFAIATLLFGSGCSKEYDDSALTGRVDNLEGRVDRLEELCRQMNTNISSLQTLVAALQSNDYVTGVTPVTRTAKQSVIPSRSPKAHRLPFTTVRKAKTAIRR